MELNDVVKRFAQMADLDTEEAEQYRSLCENARQQIAGLKKENVGKEGEPFLCEAAAALVLYRWTMQNAASGLDSFSVGEITVTKSGAHVEFARQLWQEAEAAAAPYLHDRMFVFAGVTA